MKLDQKTCGCCWASSANYVLSYQNLQYGTKQLLDFSDQALIDCVSSSKGCGGGNPLFAFQHVNARGIPVVATYPFKEANQVCKRYTSVYKCGKTAYSCMSGNETALLNLLNNHGVLSISKFTLIINF